MRRGRATIETIIVDGSIIAESALLVPFFVLLLFGMLEFGGAFRDYLTLSNGATTGARQAASPGPRGGRRGIQRWGAPLTTPFTPVSACPPIDGVCGPPPPIDGGGGPLTPDAWVRRSSRRLSQDGVMTTLRAEFSAALENTS